MFTKLHLDEGNEDEITIFQENKEKQEEEEEEWK